MECTKCNCQGGKFITGKHILCHICFCLHNQSNKTKNIEIFNQKYNSTQFDYYLARRMNYVY
jgi:hypothetical protein